MTKLSISKLYVGGFLSIIAGLLVLFLLSPKQTFSQFENRPLQSKLSINWSNLIDKTFAEDAEKYVLDQFPYRQQWFQLKSIAEQGRLMTVNNGILKGKNDYLFEPMKEPVWEDVDYYVDSVNQFFNSLSGTHMSILLAPTSIEMYPQLMPSWSNSYSQEEAFQFIANALNTNINVINAKESLEAHTQDKQEIYYRNDHHWTSYGAYVAYVQYMRSLNIEPMTLAQLQEDTVSTNFLGSYYIKGQFWGASPDNIISYSNAALHSSLYIADRDETMNSLYDESALKIQDQYRYYLGGVHALTVIHTTANSKKPADEPSYNKLLVIKDSYAHNFLPFLTNHFKEIHVIDPRYYNGSIQQYIEDNQFNEVLMLYNIPTFVSERSLLKLKY